MTGERPLAVGRTAEIFPWKSHEVVKLFHEWVSVESIRAEHAKSVAVHRAGIASPGVGEIVAVGTRSGIVYEKIDGRSMGSELRSRPWMFRYFTDMLSDLHRAVSAHIRVAGIPEQRAVLERRLNSAPGLDAGRRKGLITLMRTIPPGKNLCHGDFHFDNVIVSSRGPVIIDWTDATTGNPAADLARSALLLCGHLATSRNVRTGERLIVTLVVRRYVARCLAGESLEAGEYEKWRPILAGARLAEGIPELESWLLAEVRRAPGGSARDLSGAT